MADEYTDEDFEDISLDAVWPDEGPANFKVVFTKASWHIPKEGSKATKQPKLDIRLEFLQTTDDNGDPLGWDPIFHTFYLGANAGKNQLSSFYKAAMGEPLPSGMKPVSVATALKDGLVNAKVQLEKTPEGNITRAKVDGFSFTEPVLDEDDDDDNKFGIS